MTDSQNALDEDCRAVNKAADLLELREIDFFRLAHRRWFSKDAEPKQMEQFFTRYMFHEIVPPWVRHCAREVLNRHGMNMLDPAAFGAADFRPRNKVPKVGNMFLVIAAVLMLIVYISILTTKLGFEASNCPGRNANSFIEQWVYMINGQQPPACDVPPPTSPAPR